MLPFLCKNHHLVNLRLCLKWTKKQTYYNNATVVHNRE